jgi:hypothetical protein
MSPLISLIPGAGPALAAASGLWSVLTSRAGRIAIVAAVAFIGGWQAKGRLDEAATLRAVISKQRIDLQAAQQTADSANAIIADIATRDGKHQEIIHDLQLRLAQRPGGACALDDAAAHGLRRLR